MAESMSFQMPQIQRYRYRSNVTSEIVNRDVKLIKREWNKRLSETISEEAKGTSNWNMLWKVEAALSSLEQVIINKNLELEKLYAAQGSSAFKIEGETRSVVSTSPRRGTFVLASTTEGETRGRNTTNPLPEGITATSSFTEQRQQQQYQLQELQKQLKQLKQQQSSLSSQTKKEKEELVKRFEEKEKQLMMTQQLLNEIIEKQLMKEKEKETKIDVKHTVIPPLQQGQNVQQVQIEQQPQVKSQQQVRDVPFHGLGMYDRGFNYIKNEHFEKEEVPKQPAIIQQTSVSPEVPYSTYTGSDFSGLSSYGGKTTIGGVGIDTLEREIAELKDAQNKLKQQAKIMFNDFKGWTGCGGDVDIPIYRPHLEGFNALSARLVDWFVLPRMSVMSTFPLQRQTLLFGPPGSGKTVIANLVVYDAGERLQQTWLKSAVRRGEIDKANLRSAAGEMPPKEFVVLYYADMLRLRSDNPEQTVTRLRNFLHCLQFEIVQKRREWRQQTSEQKPESVKNVTEPPNPMALLIVDNLDVVFMTEDERKRQPRAARQSNAEFQGHLYKQTRDLSSLSLKNGGGNVSNKQNNNLKIQKNTNDIVARLDGPRSGGANVEQMLINLLSTSNLQANFPDVRLIWMARYVWYIPQTLRQNVKGYELFVDLPSDAVRKSEFKLWIRVELAKNIAATLNEMKTLELEISALPLKTTAQKTIDQYMNIVEENADSRSSNEPDQQLYRLETEVRMQVRDSYYFDKSSRQNSPIVPQDYQIVDEIFDKNTNAGNALKAYLREMESTIDFITDATGMSLGGYCQLQQQYRLTFSEVDTFLLTSGRRTVKGQGLAGYTPFGFTIEDMIYFQNNQLKQTTDGRLMRAAMEDKHAFIVGDQKWASSSCKQTARAVQMYLSREPEKFRDFNLNKWYSDVTQGNNIRNKTGENGTCRVALSPDLRDVTTGAPIIPMSARYGSHRILRSDVIKALGLFMQNIIPKTDYPQFVSYVLFGRPTLNRGPLPQDQVSAICRTRPGPISSLLLSSARNPVSFNTFNRPSTSLLSSSTLSPFVLLNSENTIRFGGCTNKTNKNKKIGGRKHKPIKTTTRQERQAAVVHQRF